MRLWYNGIRLGEAAKIRVVPPGPVVVQPDRRLLTPLPREPVGSGGGAPGEPRLAPRLIQQIALPTPAAGCGDGRAAAATSGCLQWSPSRKLSVLVLVRMVTR
jgi:hypothetical protein